MLMNHKPQHQALLKLNRCSAPTWLTTAVMAVGAVIVSACATDGNLSLTRWNPPEDRPIKVVKKEHEYCKEKALRAGFSGPNPEDTESYTKYLVADGMRELRKEFTMNSCMRERGYTFWLTKR